VIGNSVSSTPSGAIASFTALAIAAGGPIAPPSPIPFWPNIDSGDGVAMCSIRGSGTSVAPGSR